MSESFKSGVANAVEAVLREWERADLGPEGAGVRRGMALEIRLTMRKVEDRPVDGSRAPKIDTVKYRGKG